MAIKPLIGRWGQGWIRNTQDLLLHGLDYFKGLPTWVQNKASLSFSAEGAEQQGDYEAGTLYFRDSNFNRVGATFSRTTTATRVNKQGLIESVAANVPRIDYSDGSAKLLMEPSRTNIMLYTQDFSNAYWSNDNAAVTSNATTSIDGTVNADLIVADGTVNNANAGKNGITLTGGGTWTQSYYVKYFNNQWVAINLFAFSNSGVVYFDILNGSVGTTTNATATITDAGDGWYRITATIDIGTVDVSGNSVLWIAEGDNDVVWPSAAAIDGKGMYVDRAQLEQGSYPTSYIPTSGSAVTRNGDALTNDSLGGYFNTNEGTAHIVYNEYPFKGSVTENAFSLYETAGSKYMRHRGDDSVVIAQPVGFAAIISINLTAVNLFRWDGSDFAVFQNGSLTNSSSQTADFNPIGFGSSTSGIVLGGYRKIIIFPTALTDSECEQLTS